MRLLLALLALSSMAQPPTTADMREREQAMGRQLALEIRQRAKPLENPRVTAYVRQLGARLVSHLPEQPAECSFEVLQTSETTEPMPLPGGYILIPARLFLDSHGEDEFAGVLAHAIGHVALEHGMRKIVQGRSPEPGRIPIVFMGGWMGLHADSRQTATLLPAGMLELQRNRELEADAFGIELAARAGHDAAAYQRYVERAQRADSASLALPARELRLAWMTALLGSIQPVPTARDEEFQRVRQTVREAAGIREKGRTPTLLR